MANPMPSAFMAGPSVFCRSPGSPFRFTYKTQAGMYLMEPAWLSVTLVPDPKSGNDDVGCSIQPSGICFCKCRLFFVAVLEVHFDLHIKHKQACTLGSVVERVTCT